MLGVCVANKKYHTELMRWRINSGQCVGPDDVFHALRGLRTLPLRLIDHFLIQKKSLHSYQTREKLNKYFILLKKPPRS